MRTILAVAILGLVLAAQQTLVPPKKWVRQPDPTWVDAAAIVLVERYNHPSGPYTEITLARDGVIKHLKVSETTTEVAERSMTWGMFEVHQVALESEKPKPKTP